VRTWSCLSGPGGKRQRVALWQLALAASALILLGLNVGAVFNSNFTAKTDTAVEGQEVSSRRWDEDTVKERCPRARISRASCVRSFSGCVGYLLRCAFIVKASMPRRFWTWTCFLHSRQRGNLNLLLFTTCYAERATRHGNKNTRFSPTSCRCRCRCRCVATLFCWFAAARQKARYDTYCRRLVSWHTTLAGRNMYFSPPLVLRHRVFRKSTYSRVVSRLTSWHATRVFPPTTNPQAPKFSTGVSPQIVGNFPGGKAGGNGGTAAGGGGVCRGHRREGSTRSFPLFPLDALPRCSSCLNFLCCFAEEKRPFPRPTVPFPRQSVLFFQISLHWYFDIVIMLNFIGTSLEKSSGLVNVSQNLIELTVVSLPLKGCSFELTSCWSSRCWVYTPCGSVIVAVLLILFCCALLALLPFAFCRMASRSRRTRKRFFRRVRKLLTSRRAQLSRRRWGRVSLARVWLIASPSFFGDRR